MARKFVEQKITKWWHAFTELKSWVQIVIAVAVVVAAHNWILHQGGTMPRHYGGKGHGGMKKGKKSKMSKMSKKKKKRR